MLSRYTSRAVGSLLLNGAGLPVEARRHRNGARSSTRVFALAAAVCGSGPAFAQPNAQDEFAYSDIHLSGQAGGTGFAAPWSIGSSWSVQSASLNYFCGGALNTGGGSASLTFPSLGDVSRSMSTAYGPGAEVWMSFLVRLDAAPAAGSRYAGVALTGTGGVPFIGMGTDLRYVVSQYGVGAPVATTTRSAVVGRTDLLLVQVRVLAGTEVVSLWINPSLQGTLGSADAVNTQLNFTVSGVRLAAGNLSVTIDELRLGPDAASVLPLRSIETTPRAVNCCAGGSAAFTVVGAVAPDLTYRWRCEGVAIDGSLNPSATTPVLTLSNVQIGDAARYDCMISNGCVGAVSSPGQVFFDAADIGMQGGVRGRDGTHDNNDFIVYIDRFFVGDAAADLGSQGGQLGSDGQFDNNDFIAFINQFFAGC